MTGSRAVRRLPLSGSPLIDLGLEGRNIETQTFAGKPLQTRQRHREACELVLRGSCRSGWAASRLNLREARTKPKLGEGQDRRFCQDVMHGSRCIHFRPRTKALEMKNIFGAIADINGACRSYFRRCLVQPAGSDGRAVDQKRLARPNEADRRAASPERGRDAPRQGFRHSA
jgi:hypothetical protein